MIRTKHSTGTLPVLSLLLAASLWGVSWYPLRLLESYGINGVWTSLLVYGAAAVVGFFYIINRLHEFRQNFWVLVVVAAGNAWCNIAFILAILDGNVVRVLLLFYLSPLWTTLFGWLFLHERLTRFSIFILLVAMVGALVMLWDPTVGMPIPRDTTDWLAISAGMAFSVGNIAVRKLQDVSLKVKLFSAWIGVVVLALILIFLSAPQFPQVQPSVIIWTLIAGAILVFIMTYTVQYGVTHMPVYRSAVILLFELVVGAVSSLLLTQEVISIQEWLGGGLIIFAAYLSARSTISAQRYSVEPSPGM